MDPVGKWLTGGPTRGGLIEGVVNAAAFVLLWHCAQLELVEGALAWIAVSDGITLKSVLVWQAVQVPLAAVGMWFDGLIRLLGLKENPMWHCEHSPLAGCEASATLNGPAAACGRVWNPKNPLTGYWFTPNHTALVSWQDEQPPVAPAWIIAAVGAGSMKPVPGPVAFVALPGTRPTGVLAWWQASQLVVVGRCAFGPGALVDGITTMLLIPKKLLPVTLGP